MKKKFVFSQMLIQTGPPTNNFIKDDD